MKDPNAIYDAPWFQKDFFVDPRVKEDHFLCADGIFREFRPMWARDYGCGPGFIIERLNARGVYASGFEGSMHGIARADDSIRAHITHVDITTMAASKQWARVSEPGVTICTEFAEHLEERFADHLVDLLCSHANPIVFTAATPGQGGHDHVNEQPHSYWREKFQQRGALYDHAATERMRARWSGVKEVKCMPANVMVFS